MSLDASLARMEAQLGDWKATLRHDQAAGDLTIAFNEAAPDERSVLSPWRGASAGKPSPLASTRRPTTSLEVSCGDLTQRPSKRPSSKGRSWHMQLSR